MADDVTNKTEIIEGNGEGQLAFITLEQETIEAMPGHVDAPGEVDTHFEENKPAMKPACKGKRNKKVAATENEGK